MNRQAKVKRVLDSMCDCHRDIVAELEKFNNREVEAQPIMATSHLARAAKLMEIQATRLHNLVWEIEQAV